MMYFYLKKSYLLKVSIYLILKFHTMFILNYNSYFTFKILKIYYLFLTFINSLLKKSKYFLLKLIVYGKNKKCEQVNIFSLL